MNLFLSFTLFFHILPFSHLCIYYIFTYTLVKSFFPYIGMEQIWCRVRNIQLFDIVGIPLTSENESSSIPLFSISLMPRIDLKNNISILKITKYTNHLSILKAWSIATKISKFPFWKIQPTPNARFTFASETNLS